MSAICKTKERDRERCVEVEGEERDVGQGVGEGVCEVVLPVRKTVFVTAFLSQTRQCCLTL